ncbi:unnamed protein product, partial [Ectocarpus sp. 12 AP-2014]
MVSGVTQQHRGGGGGGGGGGSSIAAIDGSGGGPSIRFEGITLELSSFSGCQFDFGKSGSLVLSFNGYTGTVSLQSSLSSSGSSTPKIRGGADSFALPLCSTSSEAGSLGVLDGAEAVAMDQSDYDMALSQLEHGDSPKSSFSATAAGAAASTSPTTAMFTSPSAMRQACEGAQNPGAAAAAGGGSARTQQRQQQQQQPPSHVSPSSSMKSSGNASVIAQQAASPSAGVGPRNKRSSPLSSAGGAAAAAGTAPPAVSPDAQGPSTAATTIGKPKGKRARRVRGEESTNAPGAAAARSSTKTRRAAVVASKKTARAKRQQQRKEEDSSPNKENRPATKSPAGGTIVE